MGTTFGKLMRRRRGELGMTQEVLAERALLSTQAVGALERGERLHPWPDTLDRLADALLLSDEQRTDFLSAATRRRRPRTPATDRPPRQLPPAVPHFTGRATEVETIAQLLKQPNTPAPAIAGMAGVGKTALAVYVAHRVARRFPHGQLYLNLRGYGGGEPMGCHEALGSLLVGLGEAADRLPGDAEQAIGFYRSCLAARRILLVLDNADDVEQIRPLLPATSGCAAIVTSRRTLSALPQLHHVPLDILSEPEAVDLLAATVGRARVDAEPDAAATVVRRCGGLPLAVHLAGARLAARPQWPIAHLAGRLDQEHRRLDELSHSDTGVRASLAVSIDQLADSADAGDRLAAASYTLLGVLDTPDLSVAVTARLLHQPEEDTEETLEHLADLNLLEAASPGRYHLHDLVRVHAHQTALASLSVEEQAAALTRVLNLCAAAAWRCQVLMNPRSVRSSLAVEGWTATAPAFGDSREALGWLDDHRSQILAAVRQATRVPGVAPELIVRLSIGLFGFYLTRRHASEWSTMCRSALGSASTDRVARAVARMDLGLALGCLAADGEADWADVVAQFRGSLAEFEELGHRRLMAVCLLNLGTCLETKGDLWEAIHCVERSLALNRQLADRHEQAVTTLTLGDQYHKVGDDDMALRHYRNCLDVSEQLGYRCGMAGALRGIGVVLREAGQPALTRSAELFREIGDPDGELSAMEELGALYVELGEHHAARKVLTEALELALRYGHRRRQCRLRHSLGIALAGLGHHREAKAQWEAALRDYGQLDAAASDAVRALLDSLEPGQTC